VALIAQYPSKENPFVSLYSREISGAVRYEVRWRADGRRQRKTCTDRASAEKLAQQLSANFKANSGRYHTITNEDWLLLQKAKQLGDARIEEALHMARHPNRATVSELKSRFLDHYNDRAKRTHDDIRTKFNVIEDTFGDRYVDTITVEEIEHWYFQLPGSIRTRNNFLTALTTFLNRAKDWDYLPHDREVAGARVRRVKPLPKDPGILTPDEATQILHDAEPDLIPYLALGMFAGIRPSEAAGIIGDRDGIKWGDLDFDEKTIRIRREVAGKLGRPRVIDMHPTLELWLKPFIQKPDQPICHRTSGNKLTAANREHQWKTPWPQDGIRHSWVSYHFARDRDITATAQQAGNSPQVIEESYNNPRSKREALEWFSLTPAKVGRPLGKIRPK
jgi:integrase